MHTFLMNAKLTNNQIEAEWAREKQITAQFGLTHTILYNLRKDGKIRSASTQSEGKKHGARLFNVASIRQYLADQESAERNQ